MKKTAYVWGFALALFATSCKKLEQIKPTIDYALKFENTLPVTLQQYRYPVSDTVRSARTIYMVRTVAAKDSDIAAVLLDLDTRGWKPAIINYAIQIMDKDRGLVKTKTTMASSINPNWFYAETIDNVVTVEYFYYDNSASTLDDRFVSIKQIAASAHYVFVEKK